ncbi:MAG: exosortase-associated EpsI family protein [Phycisphaerae bacterium]
MQEDRFKIGRVWALLGSGLMLAALGLAIVTVLGTDRLAPGESPGTKGRELAFAYVAAAAAGVGAAALLAGVLARRYAAVCWSAAILPAAYLVMCATPRAVSGDVVPMVNFGVAAAVGVISLFLLRGVGSRMQYAACLGTLAVAGMFFQFWEPPPPKPVPIKKSLVEHFLRTLAGWDGKHRPLPEVVEKVVGADEYLNLQLFSPEGAPRGYVYITYNANAWSNIPHVPWVCMTQAGYIKKRGEKRDVVIQNIPGREITVNVLLFETKPGLPRARALVLQYFNVGGTYTPSREWARVLGTRGSLGREGSFLSQTQIAVWLSAGEEGDPMAKDSAAYSQAVGILNEVAPILEKEYYPDLAGAGGER